MGSTFSRDTMFSMARRGAGAGEIRTDVDVTDMMALVAGAFAAVSQLGADPVREARVLDVVMAGLSTSAEISRTPAKRGRMQ
jgi:hypothetical protein